jgi:hypothetical protein
LVRVHRQEAQASCAAQRQKFVRPPKQKRAGRRVRHAHRALATNSGVSRLLRFLSLKT